MLNYFHLLELEVNFNLTEKEIDEKYFKLQIKHHPDNKSGDLGQSALLNQAYVEIKDPLKRAKHIFELNGLNINRSTVTPSLLKLLDQPEENLQLRLEVLQVCFQQNEILKAYDAWCDCQYLARAVARSQTQ